MTSVSNAEVASKCAAQYATPNASCSATHCVRVRDGLALVWPKNSLGNRFGQLGNGIANKRLDNVQLKQAPAPMLIPSTKVSSVAASSSTTTPKTKPFVVAAAVAQVDRRALRLRRRRRRAFADSRAALGDPLKHGAN